MAKRRANAIKGISPFGEHDWQANSDLDTLIRAQEIEADPKRFAAAKKAAKARLEAVEEVLEEKEGKEPAEPDDKGKKK